MPGSDTWLQLFSAAALGGGVVKLIDRLIDLVTHVGKRRADAHMLLTKHLDPVIKACQELSSKLRFLVSSDFQPLSKSTLEGRNVDLNGKDLIETGSMLYLFLQLWGRLAILRAESTYVDLTCKKEGRWLVEFMRTLDSKQFHIVSRDLQRLLGEAMIAADSKNDRRILSFFEFLTRYQSDEQFKFWCNEMIHALRDMSQPRNRQKLIRYTVVVTAIAETLGGIPSVQRARSIANKLTHRSRQQLRHDVFDRHLTFVEERWHYCGEKKQPSAHVPIN